MTEYNVIEDLQYRGEEISRITSKQMKYNRMVRYSWSGGYGDEAILRHP